MHSEGKKVYRGLSNQGATCYMNSLLQSLYMTPEFRNRIYSWQYDPEKHGDRSDSIPFQLQLLFGSLQTSKSSHADTKGLTKSFGWNTKESFEQHDVQEFCRVLFDAIEKSVQGTPEENMIKKLYEGKMIDYVRCSNCNQESKRKDTFLDISLTVKSKFDNIYNESIEKALYNFIKPETLGEGNQYFCGNCQSKQDAVKGLKFKKLPYVLVMQLKRFDLDYETLQRIKLNDKVTFPTILNANPFLGEVKIDENIFSVPEPALSDLKSVPHDIEFKLNTEDLDLKDLKVLTSKITESIFDDFEKKPMKKDKIVKDKIIARETEQRKLKQLNEIELYKKDGEYVYELFSIMIHSGSAMGGHYFAYIKSFEDSKWRNFNDSSVKEIEEKEIINVFGGESSSGWGGYYSTNAYLLMYRKVQNENINTVEDSKIPFIISEELKNLKADDEEKDFYNSYTFKIYYGKKDTTINIKKDKTFKELTLAVIKKFEMNEDNIENIRLRGYIQYYDLLQEVYSEDKQISDLGFFNYKILAVETKNPSEEWPPYDPNEIIVKVNLWTSEVQDLGQTIDEKTSNPTKIAVNKKGTVADMQKCFEEKLKIPADKQKIFKKSYAGMSTYCEQVNYSFNLEKLLSYVGIYDGTTLYIEESDPTQIKSKWQQQFDIESKRCTIKFNNPHDKPNEYKYIECNNSIVLEFESTIQNLREMIAKKLNIPSDSFIMKRGGTSSMELKGPNLKLVQANLSNYSLIYVELGVPTGLNQHRVLFSLGQIARNSEKDCTCYEFFELFDLPVDDNIKIADLKRDLTEKLKLMFPTINLSTSNTRLRERNGDRLTKLMLDKDSLNNYIMFDRKTLCIELIDDVNETDISSSDLIILAKKWSPSTWEISECKEIIIKKNSTIHEFGTKISTTFNIKVLFI
jgi:ubiquitin carboxyl-terminal hydrolase 47